MPEAALTFDDVLLIPAYNHHESRRIVETGMTDKSGKLSLELPLMTANMDTITEDAMADFVGERGGIGVLHRFCSVEENAALYRRCRHRALQHHPHITATLAKHHLRAHFQPGGFVVAGKLGVDFLAALVVVVVHQGVLGANGHHGSDQPGDHHHHRAEHQQPGPALTIPGHNGHGGGRLAHDALTLQ